LLPHTPAVVSEPCADGRAWKGRLLIRWTGPPVADQFPRE
jgi:hypothetical protein